MRSRQAPGRQYLSSGLRTTKVTPAAAPPMSCARRQTHGVGQANMPITAAQRVIAGLNAARGDRPDRRCTGLSGWLLLVATFNTT